MNTRLTDIKVSLLLFLMNSVAAYLLRIFCNILTATRADCPRATLTELLVLQKCILSAMYLYGNNIQTFSWNNPTRGTRLSAALRI